MMQRDLFLKDLIRAVSQELLASREERVLNNLPALFEVDELTLEVSFVVTESNSADGGFDIKVVKADLGTEYDQQSIQKITLKLKSLREDVSILTDLGDELPLRPRSDG